MAELKVNEISEVHRHVIAGERIWLTADDRLVAEGDPDAASLFASEGKRISRADAIRYGLVKQSKEEKAEEQAAQKEAEAQAKAEAAALGAGLIEGSVEDVLERIGADKERAEQALAAENAKPAKERRKGVVEGLQAVLKEG